MVADGQDVEEAVAVEVGHGRPPADVGVDRRRFLRLESVWPEVVDVVAGIEVEGVFGIIANDHFGEGVVVEIGDEGIDGAPTRKLDFAVGRVAVVAARVDEDAVVAVGAPRVVVDERDADFAFRSAEEPCAARILALKTVRLRELRTHRGCVPTRFIREGRFHETPVAAGLLIEGEQQGVVREKTVGGVLHEEDHAVQGIDAAGGLRGDVDAVLRREAARRAKPDPARLGSADFMFAPLREGGGRLRPGGVLRGLLPRGAGCDGDVVMPVPVEIAGRGGHRHWGVEFEDAREGTGGVCRVEDELRSGGEREATASAQVDGVHEARRWTFLLQFGLQSRLLLGAEEFARRQGRRGRDARRVESSLTTP